MEYAGPYGRVLGNKFTFQCRKGERVRKIMIQHGWMVDAIGFEVVDKSGHTNTFCSAGCPTGNFTMVELASDEYITQMEGEYGFHQSGDGVVELISKLEICTNKRPYRFGPFGMSKEVKQIRRFKFPHLPGHGIIGLFGSFGTYLQSIGAYYSLRGWTT